MGRKNQGSYICVVCGVSITSVQVSKAKHRSITPRFCSTECMRACYAQNIDPLREPRNNHEEELVTQYIQEQKKVVQTEVMRLVQRLSPPDDSPEAERKFRQVVCPEPQFDYSSRAGASLKYFVQHPGTQGRRFHKHSE